MATTLEPSFLSASTMSGDAVPVMPQAKIWGRLRI